MFCRSSFVLFVFYCLSFFDLRFGMFSKIFISDLCYCVSKGFDLFFFGLFMLVMLSLSRVYLFHILPLSQLLVLNMPYT